MTPFSGAVSVAPWVGLREQVKKPSVKSSLGL